MRTFIKDPVIAAVVGFILIFLTIVVPFVACALKSDLKEPIAIRFRFGDRVFVPKGFYRGSKGRVVECRYWNREHASCKVDMTLISPDGRYVRNEEMTFRQEDLLEDRSEQ
jgi:hypothetical protein